MISQKVIFVFREEADIAGGFRRDCQMRNFKRITISEASLSGASVSTCALLLNLKSEPLDSANSATLTIGFGKTAGLLHCYSSAVSV